MTETVVDPNANPNPDANAWRAPLAALAGDNAEYKTALEGFKEPGELFSRLTAAPVEQDWRKVIAGEDPAVLKDLERFNDAKSYHESFKQKDDYIRSGTKVTVPGEGASPEVIAAWNAARGVPDKPDGYQIAAKPPEGLEIDDGTKTLLGGITGKLHALGAEPAIVNAAHEIVYEQVAQAHAQQEQALTEGPKRAMGELSKVWKNEGERKENLAFAAAGVMQFLGPLEGERAKALLDIPTGDGYYLGDHPAFTQFLAAVGRAHAEDPIYLEASGAGGNGKSVDAQIDEIMSLRSTDMKKYNAPETQAQLAKLVAAQQRHAQLQGRSKAA